MSSSHQKGFSWPQVLFFLLVAVILIGLLVPMGFHRRHEGDRTKTLANAKSVVAGLLIFKSDNGVYPCDATRKILENDGIDFLPLGKDANAYLAQLVATNTINSEKSFFVPG